MRRSSTVYILHLPTTNVILKYYYIIIIASRVRTQRLMKYVHMNMKSHDINDVELKFKKFKT